MFEKLSNFFKGILSDESGVTAIEYGILAAGVAIVIGVIVSQDGPLSTAINDLFNSVVSNIPESTAK